MIRNALNKNLTKYVSNFIFHKNENINNKFLYSTYAKKYSRVIFKLIKHKY